jgi:hypothetical protein
MKDAGEDTAHLPLRTNKETFPFPREWFEQLARLRGIPFNYLLPNESMLPRESIRFFVVDRLWIKWLINGAFSIGSDSEKDWDRCAAPGGSALAGLPYSLSGFVLRSDVVSGWPKLAIDGCGKPPEQHGLRVPL